MPIWYPRNAFARISLVVRGELQSAGNAIERAERQADMARNGHAKIQLARAHLSVAKRRLPDAICESLDALAFSKDAGDAQGVVAAQHMLACVYTELGLPEIASTSIIKNVACGFPLGTSRTP